MTIPEEEAPGGSWKRRPLRTVGRGGLFFRLGEIGYVADLVVGKTEGIEPVSVGFSRRASPPIRYPADRCSLMDYTVYTIAHAPPDR